MAYVPLPSVLPVLYYFHVSVEPDPVVHPHNAPGREQWRASGTAVAAAGACAWGLVVVVAVGMAAA